MTDTNTPRVGVLLLDGGWSLATLSSVDDCGVNVTNESGKCMRVHPSRFRQTTPYHSISLALGGEHDVTTGDECIFRNEYLNWIRGLVLDTRADGSEYLVARVLSNGALVGTEYWVPGAKRQVVPLKWLVDPVDWRWNKK